MSDLKNELRPVIRLMPRREFVRDGVVVAGGILAGTSLPTSGNASQATPAGTAEATPVAFDPESYVPIALSAVEIEALKAASDRIIPSDELGPGASESGVFIYVDQALAGPNAALLPLFQAGLKALDDVSSPGTFASLDAARQDEILKTAEAGKLAGDPGGFFQIVLEYTRQGMFSDPVHGGNRGFAGWDLINYPGIKLVWTEKDQAIGTQVVPAHKSVSEFGGTAS